MIHCLLISKNQSLKDQFIKSIHQVFQNHFEIQYQIKTFDDTTPFNENEFSLNDFTLLFFDENIEKSFLSRISKSRPDIYLIVFSDKKEITFYYDYHIYSSLSYHDTFYAYYSLLKSLISIYYTPSIKKIHFISNKMMLFIDYDQIIQLQYENHKLFLTTCDDFYQVRGSLNNYLFLVEQYNFIRASRSKIVNPKYEQK